jgi:hypothetical protein
VAARIRVPTWRTQPHTVAFQRLNHSCRHPLFPQRCRVRGVCHQCNSNALTLNRSLLTTGRSATIQRHTTRLHKTRRAFCMPVDCGEKHVGCSRRCSSAEAREAVGGPGHAPAVEPAVCKERTICTPRRAAAVRNVCEEGSAADTAVAALTAERV